MTSNKKCNFKIKFKKKKEKFPRNPSFRFCSAPQIENSEILESFILFQLLVVHETQDPKTKKNLRQKKYNFIMWLINENMKIFEVSEFSIWPYEQN